MSTESKRAWRAIEANRQREVIAHQARRTETERLAEAIRDTLRRLNRKLDR